MAKLNLIV